MPAISWEDANASITGTQAPIAPEPVAPQAPGGLELASAALRQSNIVSSLYDRYVNNPDSTAPAQPSYNPYDNNGISGYENYADRFTRSTSPEQTQVIKNRINQENADKSTIARAGWSGTAASIAAGVIDPVTIASMAIPVAPALAGAGRLARIGLGVAANVAAGEAQAGAIASTQETGDYGQGMGVRIGANALLAGVFGTLATKIPKAEFASMAEKASTELRTAPIESTAGAQQVGTTTLAQESLAGGNMTAKTIGQISPVTRIMTNSPVVESRQLAQQIADVPYMLNKNIEGIATAPSVESKIGQATDIRNAAIIKNFDAQFADYKTNGGTLSRPQFSEAVSDAMRAGDVHEIPQVQKVAQDTRAIFSSDREALAKLGEMPEGTKVLGAPSYFPRVYDQHAIMNNRTDIEQRLVDHFTQNPKIDEAGNAIMREPAEVSSAVKDTLDRIQGTVRGTADIGEGLKNPSSMKARVLDVPDEVLKPYLSSDFEHVLHGYNKSMIPQIMMRQQFGSATLENEFRKITDAYHVKLSYAADDAAKAKLIKQQASDMQDLIALRDRVLNQSGPKGDTSLAFVKATNLIRGFNYLRMLGGQTTSAIPDIARAVTRYGLINTAARTAKFLTGIEANGLIRADAKRMGTALDWTLHTRAKTLSDIGDELGGSKSEQYMANATANFTKLSGVATWDSSLRAIASALEQDAIHQSIVGKTRMSSIEVGKLAAHGIGTDDLAAIKQQWLEHGSSEGGLNRARTELWTDRDAAAKIEQAVYQAGNSMAFHIGKGDLPLMMNSGTAKLIMQFKSFAMSSVNRMLIPLEQGLAHGDIKAANGAAMLLSLGALTYYVKEIASGNNHPDLSASRLIPEMVERSGLLGFLPDITDPITGALHLPRFQQFADHDPVETAMGPTVGTLAMIMKTLTGITDGKVSAADLHRLRQLAPYQNLFFLRRIIDAIEGKTADIIGAKGARNESFGEELSQPPRVEKPDKAHLFGQEEIPNAF